jgi:hypothetical protein
MQVRQDSPLPYCSIHLHSQLSATSTALESTKQQLELQLRKRPLPTAVPCPFNPTLCSGSTKPERHLRLCNYRPVVEHPLYICPNVNKSSRTVSRQFPPIQQRLCDLDASELASLIAKVERAWDAVMEANELDGTIADLDKLWPEYIDTHPSMEPLETRYSTTASSSLSSPSFKEQQLQQQPQQTKGRAKHRQQISSLLALLESHHILSPAHVYIEFGSGSAELSAAVFRAVGTPSRFVLVDKAHANSKAKITKAPEGTYSRVKADIADLLVEKLDAVKALAGCDDRLGVVGISKHLCGGATDMALRSLARYRRAGSATETEETQEQEQQQQQQRILPLAGLMMALCCHHRCTVDSYVALEFITQDCGFTEDEFSLLSCMSSWATCGQRISQQCERSERNDNDNDCVATEDEKDGDLTHDEPDDLVHHSAVTTRAGLTLHERRRVGLKCKNLINIGRRDFCRRLGLRSDLVRYTAHSLENVVLIAIP